MAKTSDRLILLLYSKVQIFSVLLLIIFKTLKVADFGYYF